MEWDAVAAIAESISAIGTIIGLIFIYYQIRIAVISTKAGHERQKKQATIEHVRTIRPLYDKCKQMIESVYGSDALTEKAVLEIIEKNDDIRTNIRELLALLEFTAVGVNTGVFDKDLWYRMSASYVIRVYHQLRPYMKRVQTGNQYAYIEFEEIALEFEKMKSKKADPRGQIELS